MTVVSPSRFKRTKAPAHNDPSTWLHIVETARLLNVTRQAVRSMVGRGDLHPIRDTRGDALFDPDEVNAYAVSHPHVRNARYLNDGELTAEAFRLLNEGAARRELIMQLRITAERADALYEEWSTGDDWDAAVRRRREQRAAERAEREERARARERAERRRTSLSALIGGGEKPRP